jgi:hypothetical protein
MPLSQKEVQTALARWHGWITNNPAVDPSGHIRYCIDLRGRVLVANDMTANTYDDLIEMVVDERMITDRKVGESYEMHGDRIRAVLRRARDGT